MGKLDFRRYLASKKTSASRSCLQKEIIKYLVDENGARLTLKSQLESHHIGLKLLATKRYYMFEEKEMIKAAPKALADGPFTVTVNGVTGNALLDPFSDSKDGLEMMVGYPSHSTHYPQTLTVTFNVKEHCFFDPSYKGVYEREREVCV
jgi:hypothetical protein